MYFTFVYVIVTLINRYQHHFTAYDADKHVHRKTMEYIWCLDTSRERHRHPHEWYTSPHCVRANHSPSEHLCVLSSLCSTQYYNLLNFLYIICCLHSLYVYCARVSDHSTSSSSLSVVIQFLNIK